MEFLDDPGKRYEFTWNEAYPPASSFLGYVRQHETNDELYRLYFLKPGGDTPSEVWIFLGTLPTPEFLAETQKASLKFREVPG